MGSLARAGTYGLAATVLVLVVSWTAFWLGQGLREAQVLLVGLGASAVNFVVLFYLVGRFVDAKLEAHGLVTPDAGSTDASNPLDFDRRL